MNLSRLVKGFSILIARAQAVPYTATWLQRVELCYCIIVEHVALMSNKFLSSELPLAVHIVLHLQQAKSQTQFLFFASLHLFFILWNFIL